jgi:putative cell wall-binding protein
VQPQAQTRGSVGQLIAAVLGGALLLAALAVMAAGLPRAERLPDRISPSFVGAAADRAATLPTHFGFGLSAAPDATGLEGWMPQSGVPWDFAYQYLAGGVNTPGTWRNWNENATFPLLYAQSAKSHGYYPVITYYEMLDSNGTCGDCGEAKKDISHLNDPVLMKAYFDDFIVLMKRLGPNNDNGVQGFGGPVIVHVEPDLTGYAENAVRAADECFGFCTGSGTDPTFLKSAVASSGHPDVSAYPNNWRGYTLALSHLRDKYAPNVLLAYHVSDWATGFSINWDHDPNLDAAALGRTAGKFAADSGVTAGDASTSPYDLVFDDVADRDAGFYDKVRGQDVWWDRQNVAFPNFKRWETYLKAVLDTAQRPGITWQVPVGNQVFKTMNETDGHYQDNRPEYFFGHVQELVDTGLIGVLIGGGATGTTAYFDAKGDGVTNPAPVCSSHGTTSGQICPDQTSTVSDDDGGFIRSAGKKYFEAPVMLKGAAAALPIARVSGSDRVGTAIAASLRGWPQNAPAAVIASARDFPDALAAAPLAGKLGGPVLLVGAAPDDRVTNEVKRLGANDVVLVGGTSAVTQAVEDNLRATGLKVRRISAAERFATAAAVAREVGGASGDVVLASGTSFADALSAGALAAKGSVPVLLTLRDQLPAATADAVAALAPKSSLVIGGPAVIADSVMAQMPTPTRLSGADRYATSVAVAQASLGRGLSVQHLHLATGTNFPDALAAGPLAARAGSALLLIDGSSATLAPATAQFLNSKKGSVSDLVVAGGTASVTDAAARAVATAAS